MGVAAFEWGIAGRSKPLLAHSGLFTPALHPKFAQVCLHKPLGASYLSPPANVTCFAPCCVYSFLAATRSLLTDSCRGIIDGTLSAGSDRLLHFLFAVFGNEPLLLVTALLAVLIRSEAESVSFQMGLGERGSQRDPMSQPLHTHM